MPPCATRLLSQFASNSLSIQLPFGSTLAIIAPEIGQVVPGPDWQEVYLDADDSELEGELHPDMRILHTTSGTLHNNLLC
jgi:hypothetical protein